LKGIREKKQVTFKGKPVNITADFSTETLKERREWNEVSQAQKENNFSSRILCPTKLSFKMDRRIKVFHGKHTKKVYDH
jgi:hypothetical protein